MKMHMDEHNSVHQVYNRQQKIRLQPTNRTSNTTIPYQLQHPQGTMHQPRPHPSQSHRKSLCAHHEQRHQSTGIEQTKKREIRWYRPKKKKLQLCTSNTHFTTVKYTKKYNKNGKQQMQV